MEVKILSQENGMATVEVTLPGKDLTEILDQVYARHQREDKLDLPRETLDESPEGTPLVQEAVQTLFSEIYQEAIEQTGLQVASEPQVRVTQASELVGVTYNLTFALRPEMKLGRYKGIHVKMPDIQPTEAEYAQAIAQAEQQNRVPTATGRPAKLGDITRIDFKGFQDGVAFAGGEGKDFPLTLGSGQFIPGFEDQLVGASAGDQVQVHVTFPEQYQAANLAGKPAVFEVTVHEVQELKWMPLTEDQKQQVRRQADSRKKDLADQQIEDQVLSVILEEAQVELPDAMVESEANICAQQFAAELSAKNMPIEQFLKQTGKTFESMRQEMYPLARRRIQLRLVLDAIAQAEGIQAEEQEINAVWEQMSQQYGMPQAQLRQYAGPDMDAEIRADIISRKAYALLRESTILDQP